MIEYSNILIRAANWVGDAVMSIPAVRVIRTRFPAARISILAKPWVADLYRRADFADDVIPYTARSLPAKMAFALKLRPQRFDCAILLQNAFEAALIARLAGIPNRIGYNRDGRGFLLTEAIRVPRDGEIPKHERFYYLELLRRAGLIETLRQGESIHLDRPQTPSRPIVGVSPGAAYGGAKRWLPERFAEAAAQLAETRNASIALFGSAQESELCERVAALLTGYEVTNYAGRTSLAEFIDLAAACEVFLTNDSGAMHVASALGVPTIAIFGATDDIRTGPTGSKSLVVREPVACSPCLLRECPIDHRCMTGVTAERVAREALRLLNGEA